MSIYSTAVNKPISTLMIFTAILVLGIASYLQLPVDQYPKMDPPYITVMAAYPGANASDIEENVTKILEDQLNSVDELKEMTSTSYDNLSVVSLEFEWEVNLDEASNDVRDAVDKAMQDLPDDMDRPTIMKINTSSMPILIYAVTAKESYPGLDKIIDDKLITRLNRVDGLASAVLSGGPERVVYVDLDPNKLDAYNLTLEQIGSKIQAENMDVASGNVKMGLMDYSLRVEGEFEESDQIKDIVLGTMNNRTIYLHDVATVRDTVKDITLEQTINRRDGGVLMITKQTDANAVEVAEQAKKEIELAKKELPSDIQFQIISDNSRFIIQSVDGYPVPNHLRQLPLHHPVGGQLARDLAVRLAVRGHCRVPVPRTLAGHFHHRPDDSYLLDCGVHLPVRHRGVAQHDLAFVPLHRDRDGGGRCHRGPGKRDQAHRPGKPTPRSGQIRDQRGMAFGYRHHLGNGGRVLPLDLGYRDDRHHLQAIGMDCLHHDHHLHDYGYFADAYALLPAAQAPGQDQAQEAFVLCHVFPGA